MPLSRRDLLAAGGGAAALLASGAQAQAFPSRPITIVVPYPPGAATDQVARLVQQRMQTEVPVPVVVESRAGANGNVGAAYVAKSPPDGYTLLAMSNTFTVAPSVVAQPGYDPIKDFDPVSIINASPLVIVVRPQSPVQNLQQLVQLARDKPDQVTYGSAGSGSSSHLAPLLFFREAGAPKAVHIPYKGNAPAIVDVMGGHLMMVMDAVITTHEHIKGGRLKGLAVAARSRVPAIPDVPTFGEQGFPNIVLEAFSGICAPAGTPREIRAKLHQSLTQAMKPDMRERLRANGQDLRASASPEEFGEFIRGEVTRFARVVKEAGIKPE